MKLNVSKSCYETHISYKAATAGNTKPAARKEPVQNIQLHSNTSNMLV